MPIIGSRLLLFGLSFFREKSLRIPENDAIVFLNLEERKNGYDRIGEKIRHDDASDDDGTHHRYLKGANRAQIRWKGLLFLYASVEHVLKFQRMVRSPYQNQKILIRFFCAISIEKDVRTWRERLKNVPDGPFFNRQFCVGAPQNCYDRSRKITYAIFRRGRSKKRSDMEGKNERDRKILRRTV